MTEKIDDRIRAGGDRAERMQKTALDAQRAWADHAAERQAIDERTALLRNQRLAREAAERAKPAPAKAKSRSKAKKASG